MEKQKIKYKQKKQLPASIIGVIILLLITLTGIMAISLKTPVPLAYHYTNNSVQELSELKIFEEWTDREYAYAVGDFDGNKIDDLAFYEFGGQSIDYYLGSQQQFTKYSLTTEVQLDNLIAGDITGDGSMDLLATNSDGKQIQTYWFDQEAKLLATCGEFDFDSSGSRIYSGDFDGNGLFEIMKVSQEGQIINYSSQSSSCFNFDFVINSQLPLISTSANANIAVGDLNGDTYHDIFVSQQSEDHVNNYIYYGANLAVLQPELNDPEISSELKAPIVGLTPFVKSQQLQLGINSRVNLIDINGDYLDDIVDIRSSDGQMTVFSASQSNKDQYQKSTFNIREDSEAIFGKFNLNGEINLTPPSNYFQRPYNIAGKANLITITRQHSRMTVGAAIGGSASVTVGTLTPVSGQLNYNSTPTMTSTNPLTGSKYQVGDYNGDGLDDVFRVEPSGINGSILPGGTTTVTNNQSIKLVGGSTFKINYGLPNISVFANLTVVSPEGAGYMSVYPCSEGAQGTSAVNYSISQTIAVGVIAKTDNTGNTCVLSQYNTHFIWDSVATASPSFNSTPKRVFDSRTVSSVSSATPIAANTPKTINLGIASANASIVGTLTIVGPSSVGFARVYPCGTSPTISNINYQTNQTIANTFATKADAAGNICLSANSTTHAIIDIAASTNALTAITPIRNFDSRLTNAKINAGATATVTVSANMPTTNLAIGNLTITDVEGLSGQVGFATVWPCGQTRPNFSNINFVPGQTIANFVTTAVNSNKQLCIYSTLKAHIIWDTTAFTAVATINNQKRVYDSRAVPITTQLTNFNAISNLPTLNLKSPYRTTAGDYNGDGREEILIYQPSNTDEDFFVYYNTATASYTRCRSPSQIGGDGYYPFTGDFNGDNIDDIYWVWPDASAASNVFWFGSSGLNLCSANFTKITSVYGHPNYVRMTVGDYNGDGADDLFEYTTLVSTVENGTTINFGEKVYFGIKGTATGKFNIGNLATISRSDYQIISGEFTGDNQDDILWYSPVGGYSTLWQGLTLSGSSAVPTVGASVVLAGGSTPLAVKVSRTVGIAHSLMMINELNALSALNINPVWPGCSSGQEPNITTGVCPSGVLNNNSNLPIPPNYPQRTTLTAPSFTPLSGVPKSSGIDTNIESRLANYINTTPAIMNFWSSSRYMTYIDIIDDSQYQAVTNAGASYGFAKRLSTVRSQFGSRSYGTQLYIRAFPLQSEVCHNTIIFHELAHAEQYQSGRLTRSIPDKYSASPQEIDAELRMADILGMPYTTMQNYYRSLCSGFIQGYSSAVNAYLNEFPGGQLNLQSTANNSATYNFPDEIMDITPK